MNGKGFQPGWVGSLFLFYTSNSFYLQLTPAGVGIPAFLTYIHRPLMANSGFLHRYDRNYFSYMQLFTKCVEALL